MSIIDRVTTQVDRAAEELVLLEANLEEVKTALRKAFQIANDELSGEYVADVMEEICTAYDRLFDDYIYDDTQSGGD